MFYFVRKQLCDLNLIQYSDFSTSMSKHAIVKSLEEVMLVEYKVDWLNKINAIQGSSGRGGNKLRTYCIFQQEFCV